MNDKFCGLLCGTKGDNGEEKNSSGTLILTPQGIGETKLTRTVLLLGGTESGKSTVLKQMRLKYGTSFGSDKAELRQFRDVIRNNIWSIVGQLISAFNRLGLREPSELESLRQYTINPPLIDKDELQSDLDNIVSNETLEKIRDDLLILWKHPDVQDKILSQYHYPPIHVLDSIHYWFPDNIGRVLKIGYLPTEKDILQSRTMTMGVHDYIFNQPKYILRVTDVGGAKTQRNKWLQLFTDANAIIFIAALNGYCQPLEEDPKITRLQDSLSLFGSLINNQYLTDVPIILFLNKKDLFKRMIKTVPLSVCFPNYHDLLRSSKSLSIDNGDQVNHKSSPEPQNNSPDAKDVAQFIRDQFLETNTNPKREIKCHVTCATDKTQLQKVIQDISRFWLKSAFDKFGLT